jgi:transaldolase
LELAGCDRLTIAPKLLEELKSGKVLVPPKLSAAAAATTEMQDKISLDEEAFRWMMNGTCPSIDVRVRVCVYVNISVQFNSVRDRSLLLVCLFVSGDSLPRAQLMCDYDLVQLNTTEDAMATEKLAEGIRNFAKDLVKLEL